jgi:drug/metabolite transporter (DMT)-like permease
MSEPTGDQVRRGIFCMIASFFVFSVVHAMVKWLVARYPLTEVAFFRCLFSLVPLSVLVAMNGGLAAVRTSRPGGHIARGLMQFLAMITIFAAFRTMPLADAIAITFSAPLFVTMLSVPFLGERVGIHRWSAVLVGFVGILLMVRPGPGVLSAGALIALANAVIGAAVTISIRRASFVENGITILAYQLIVPAVLSVALLPLGWVTPSWGDGVILAASGLLHGVGQFWWTQAFRFAPPAVCAPFTYTSMIWAMMFGYAFWGEVPSALHLAGAGIVMLSGLYILYRETVRARRAKAPTTSGEA